ncbi:LamG-like jellyroll fold domain-containing protein [Comamonas sp. MYb396]|uniref:LamG-like jellyroll fold domain-containing protein n=1 Tax=Comamonas sp. MYb396 TaxID=2745302 RepID=UPI0030B58D5D
MYQPCLPPSTRTVENAPLRFGSIRILGSACITALLALPALAAPAPTPDIIHYRFDEAGTSVTNRASNPPANTATAVLNGALSQGAHIDGTNLSAARGSGNSSSSDYVNTAWTTSLNGSWSISYFSSEIAPSSTLFYIMGDISAGSFRIFTNGVAGPNNWILRGPFTDVLLEGGAVQGTTLNTFVYDSAAQNISAYLNGVLVNTVAQPEPITVSGTGPFKVMGYSSNVGLNAGGKLGDVRIYSRALTSGEVTDIYNAAFRTPQVLTFSAAPAVSVNSTANVVATSAEPNSGNAIVYSTASTDCTVTSSGAVTGVHAGTNNCTITATQAGLEIPLPGFQEASATQALSISKDTQSITFTSVPPSGASIGDTYAATATGGASGEDVTLVVDSGSAAICSIANGTVTFSAAGTCVINANQAGNPDYEAATQVQQTIEVGKLAQSLSFTSVAPANAKVGDTYTPAATGGASGNPVVFSVSGVPQAVSASTTAKASADVCSISGGVVSFSAPGTCTIMATQAGNESYAGAEMGQVVYVSAAAAAPTPVPSLHHAALLLLSLLAGMLGMRKLHRKS